MSGKRTILFLILCCSMLGLQASHIVGGSLGYAFLGNAPGGLFRYKIILTTYTDCSPGSEIPQPEPNVSVGLYLHDAANPTANKVLKQTYSVPLTFSELITPPLPPGCSVGQGTCINKGVYELEILLEPSLHGYHLYYERCCRNSALVNIINPAQTSTGFHAFIPPTSVPNSSPVFLDDPVPLICVQDSLFLLNTAIDPDGDLLLYSFTTPYAGFADVSNPAPSPQAVLPWPITPVVYQGGFSQSQPFGPGGYTYINAQNGLSVYRTLLPGNFAVAVQVSEYRNNILISTTRRDMQFIGLACPMNQAPVGSFSMGLDITAVEGDTLCFDFGYDDPDQDSVFIEVAGEPFLSFPAATFTQSYLGTGNITGTVCWTPPCGSARALPYLISYKAYDDGCIPKTRVNSMRITVVPDTATMHLSGDTLVCGLQTAHYETDKTSGVFHWNVNGGILSPPTIESSADVSWNLGQGQQGEIMVIRDGVCSDDTASITVQIAPPQFAGALPDVWLCPGSSQLLEAEPGGSGYLWYPSGWLNDSTIHNPITHTPDSLVYHVFYRDSLGCEKYDSVSIHVNAHVPVEAGNDISVCEGISIILGGNPTGPSSASFQWTPNTFLSDDTVANPSLLNPQQGWYYVEVFVDTCHSIDSLSVSISPYPAADAGNDTSFCAGNTIQLNGLGNGNITWNPNGTTLSSTQVLHPELSAPAGIYSPVLTITSNEGCSKSDTVQIEIYPLPNLTVTGNGLSSLCRGDSTVLTVTGADNYVWNSAAYISPINLPTVQVYTDSIDWFYVTATDTNGCVSSDSIQVEVFRAYLQNGQNGIDSMLCLGDSLSLSFVPQSSANVYWEPSDYLSDNTGITVISSPPQDITYTAFATNVDGCVDSASVSLSVKPLPILDGTITYTSKLFCEYVEVTLSTENITDSTHWLLNNLLAGTGNNITAQLNPKNPGQVSLTGSTQYGCMDTIPVTINFGSLEDLLPNEFPNIITPNGDFINDVWSPTLPDGFETCMRLTIYNRWGNEVFDSETFPLTWNGKTKQENALTDGVYFYVLEIGGIYKKGSVTIAR